MRKTVIYKIERTGCLALLLLILGTRSALSQEFCTKAGTERYAGTQDGFRYELWNQNAQGTACMTLGEGALFSGEWDGILNYLARRGLGYNQTQEHQDIGYFYATYNCKYHPSAASGNSYLSIYGWTVDPLIEYYIVEDWRNWIPSMDANATLKGTIEVNGSIYDIWENTRTNQPSIVGTATFQQYFSIRRNKRTSGKIDISDHFLMWESLGMDMGKMYEVSFVVEGYQSSGSFDFTELDVFKSSKPVAVKETSARPSPVSIYPNPASGEVSVRLDESVVNANMKIYDSSGRLVLSRENPGNGLLQLSNLESGMYFVNVHCNSLNYTTRFLIY